jgi:hypothetical protein
MSQRQLASVLFAVIGVFIALTWSPQVIILSLGMLASGDQVGPVPYAITLLIGTIIAVLLGILLVLVRVRLAEGLFAADTGSLDARDTQAVALSVLGCYVVIQSLPRLVGHGFDWLPATQLVLGIGLFFGARGLARLWTAARTAGSSRSDERPN